jgi:hypothetical protein
MTKNIVFAAAGLLLATVTTATAGDGKEGTRIRDSVRASSSYEGIRSDYSAYASDWRAFKDNRRAGTYVRQKSGQHSGQY